MPFDSGPVLTYVGAGQYKTIGESVYVGASDVIRIPSDFPTDLASVPRILWALVPPHGVWERAAVLHDWAVTDGIRSGRLTSRQADGLFRRVIREAQQARKRSVLRAALDFAVRWEMYWGVRLGALRNPLRRPGSLRTLPFLVVVGLLNLAALAAAVWGLDRLAHWIF